MITIMDKHTIITLKNQGKSSREVARITGFSRKTVKRYWDNYQKNLKDLSGNLDKRTIQEAIIEPPKYDSSKRTPVKYTSEIDGAIDEILASEKEKCLLLGSLNKQKLTCVQIHELLLEQGFDIGRSTVTNHVKVKRQKAKEAFICQRYDLGSRLEYDFGEVKLVIDGVAHTYHLAVLASPVSGFRWAYIYENQKKEVFLDSHVRFFEMIGGVYSEVVYDNMKNVVSRFIGKNERELNADLVKMSLYYGFSINVTNCFSGNEKGYVESSVKWLRNKVFSVRYKFDSLDEARDYLKEKLIMLNSTSGIEQEKDYLSPARPPLEIARISEHSVDKYSFIRLDNCFYSVPDYLVGHTLAAKTYPEDIIVFMGFREVARHKRLFGQDKYSVDIFHYLDTLIKKPGALKNSVALRSKTRLKEIFDRCYANTPKDFVELLFHLKEKPIDEIADILTKNRYIKIKSGADTQSSVAINVQRNTQAQLLALSKAFLKGGDKVAC